LFVSGIEGHVNENLASQIDIPPTILHFYGFSIPGEYRGFSLLVNNEREYVIGEVAHDKNGVYIMDNKIHLLEFILEFRTYAIRTKRWKYICRYDKADNRKCDYIIYQTIQKKKLI